MSSVRRGIIQNLTRTFVVTQNDNTDNNGAYFFADDAVDVWYAANAAKITKIGNVYIIPSTASGSTFVSVVNGDDGNTRLGGNGTGDIGTISDRKSLKDFGTEVVIGNLAEPRLLVLRRVQEYASSTNGGRSGDPSLTGYVVTENNTEELASNNAGRFTVRVARI
jgi:hypothetical protein